MEQPGKNNNLNPRVDDMENRTITLILLVVSAFILLLQISIFVSLIPSKVPGLTEYKKQVNSTLSDQEFIEELMAQNLAQKQTIESMKEEINQQGTLLTQMAARLNMSADIENNPFSRIGREDIEVYNDRVIIYVNKAFGAGFTSSRSMYPFIDENVFALEVRPENQSALKVGDIIGFESKVFNTTIIHRIIEVGKDESDWYAITKGDNNPAPDPGKVRFEDIRGVLVGLIY